MKIKHHFTLLLRVKPGTAEKTTNTYIYSIFCQTREKNAEFNINLDPAD